MSDYLPYSAYSDESYHIAKQYRSIGLFSFKNDFHNTIEKELSQLFKSSDINEFKWKYLASAKSYFCACKIIDYVINNLKKYDIRVDVIIWDTHDERHSIQKRDDNANFERMLYHLLHFVMRKRPLGSLWSIYHDEGVKINWDTINKCLNHTSQNIMKGQSNLWEQLFSDKHFSISNFGQIKSHESPFCQLADFFAGISVFSINSYSNFKKWKKETCKEKQITLDFFEEVNEETKFSNSELYRFKALEYLDNKCKQHSLQVSLKTHKCLRTKNSFNPINFWHYQPQHSYDKAPVKDTL